VATNLADKLRAALEPSLGAGEELSGACVATQVGIFRGRQVAIGVTPERLLIQGMNRKFEPDGPPLSLPPERLASAVADGAGGGWPELGAAIMDKAAVTLKLRTSDGEKLKLTMMRGDGPLGGLARSVVRCSGDVDRLVMGRFLERRDQAILVGVAEDVEALQPGGPDRGQDLGFGEVTLAVQL
jgi:hypothetical protein